MKNFSSKINEPAKAARDALLLLGLVSVFGYLTTPHNPFLTGTAVHPYLFIVVLIAIRYGTLSGIITAASLAIMYELGGQFRGAESSFPSLLNAPHSFTVCGVFLFAVLTGPYSDSLRQKIREMGEETSATQKNLKFLESHNQLLEKTNRDLRSRIQEETTTFQSLYDTATKLTTLEPQFLYPAVLELIVDHLKAQSCSFYLVNGETLSLTAQRGWENIPADAKNIPVNQGLLGKAFRDKSLVSLKDLAYQDELDYCDKIVAVPVCSQLNDETIGIIAIEKIPFEQLNPQTLRTLKLIAEWASKAIANVALFSETEEESLERERMLSQLISQIEAGNMSRSSWQQLALLDESTILKITDKLLSTGLNPTQQDNLLIVLERLHFEGKQLSPEFYPAFIEASLRSWYIMERYRLAVVADANAEAGDLLLAYLQERLGLYRSFVDRTLRMLQSDKNNTAVTAPGELSTDAVSDKKLVALIEGMWGKSSNLVAKLSQEHWKIKHATFDELLPELLNSPDPLLKSTTVHSISLSRNSAFLPEVLGLLKDESPLVRETALQALAMLSEKSGDQKIKELCMECAEVDPDPMVQEAASNAVAIQNFRLEGKDRRQMQRS